MPFEAFLSMGLAFLLGMAVGGVLRGPIRAFLAVLGVALGLYGLWAQEEVRLWVEGWAAYLAGEVSRMAEIGARWAAWAVREPQRAVEFLGGYLVQVGPTYAFFAGVLGRVLA